MNKKDKENKIKKTSLRNYYSKILTKPILIMILLTIIAFLTSFWIYFGVNSQEQLTKKSIYATPISIIILLISLYIYGYSGYNTVKRYNGTIKNAFLVGLILGVIQSLLSLLNMIIMYFTIPVYKQSILSIISNPLFKSLILIGVIIGIILSIIISGGVSSLGGYIARKR